ncbi:Polyamine transporter 4-like protein 2 [Colletotrichum chlorophyti]|uniref:Polyamine transporter 4-like protein 2 n=1 Tax=Colletotrichum chlorophyti TaxID=708187 RepID=A0A1Q8RG85_9PEZI|nr:Polyamine transporter 4-like protein 2 [Colletotrichum chlorophyti]
MAAFAIVSSPSPEASLTTKDIEKSAGDDTTSFEDARVQPQIQWSDPRESRNPKNWSLPMKLLHTAIPCFLAFEITFATSVTVPAINLITEEFSVSRTKSVLPLTLYTMGIAVGPLFIAPFSEVFGRKWIYVASCTCLLAFLGGSAAATTFSGLLACRFLAGTLGSAGIAVGAGTIADIWDLGKGAAASLLYILGPFLGPTLGPLAGAYVLKDRDNDWRWTQYVLLIVGAPIWLGSLFMKETSKSWILRKESGEQQKITPTQLANLAKTAIMRPTKMLLTEVIVSSLAIYTAFAYAMIFSYLASASYVLQRFYGFNLQQVGLSFISVIIGYLLAAFVYGFIDKKFRMPAVQKGTETPELRLYAALVGSVALPVSLFWYVFDNVQWNWNSCSSAA